QIAVAIFQIVSIDIVEISALCFVIHLYRPSEFLYRCQLLIGWRDVEYVAFKISKRRNGYPDVPIQRVVKPEPVTFELRSFEEIRTRFRRTLGAFLNERFPLETACYGI